MSSLPPLLGDGHGRYRVQILGNSEILGLPYISMDKLKWNPGWVKNSREEFEAKLRHAFAQDPRGWVVDGNYARRGENFVGEATTDIIWLDPPLYVYFHRIAWRTLLRLLRLSPPCSPGCEESFTEVFFSKESILWWCLSNHWIVRQRNKERMKLIGLECGSDVSNRRMRRFGGWGSDVKAWLSDVAAMVSAKKSD
ncbi:hypothetical protein BDN70DRAFT_916084 [Pholiota conissans]|uniref:Uncharacterized protein n=1 Tax=Pholiota conissans TaxID=109636 RepID=A0A9P6CLF2_9AGAR|nr:hypothetical protein BDN70DRAFT_916084 [Pholiota conissans]